MKLKLSEIASFSKGQQINGDELSDEYQYPFINGGVNRSGMWKHWNVEGNTVTISEGGNSCGFVNFVTEPFWCGAHCYYLFDVKGNPKYLYYALKSQESRLMASRSGCCMPNLKKKALGDFLLCYDADANIQQKVIKDLDACSSVCALSERELAKLDRLVKSRFVEMFGDPATNTKSWTIVELGDALVSIGNGKSFVCESFPRMGDAPAILKLSAATWGVYKPEENKALKPGSKYYPECEVRNGDLLFTRKNTFDLVGMCAYVRKTPPNLMLPDLIFRLETNGKIDKLYLANLINFDTFRASVRGLASGSAASMPNISKTRLLGLKIPLPPLALQREFAAFVAEVDKSKFAVRKRLEKARLLYRAKLQEYFG